MNLETREAVQRDNVLSAWYVLVISHVFLGVQKSRPNCTTNSNISLYAVGSERFLITLKYHFYFQFKNLK